MAMQSTMLNRCIQGLEACSKLQELYVSRQRVRETQGLQFNAACMKSLGALRVLEASSSGVSDLQPLAFLKKLNKLVLINNRLQSFAALEPLTQCTDLNQLSIKQNPVQQLPKYREKIILKLWSLVSLDEYAISQQERLFLYKLVSRQVHKDKIAQGSHMQGG
mmetsp:Transcript_11252/g.39110  ORF Transcript_11252/g.39110 Transcript_11252/m.39110 type:complete len:163 (-) Transcript_11252:346-834(-)